MDVKSPVRLRRPAPLRGGAFLPAIHRSGWSNNYQKQSRLAGGRAAQRRVGGSRPRGSHNGCFVFHAGRNDTSVCHAEWLRGRETPPALRATSPTRRRSFPFRLVADSFRPLELGVPGLWNWVFQALELGVPGLWNWVFQALKLGASSLWNWVFQALELGVSGSETVCLGL